MVFLLILKTYTQFLHYGIVSEITARHKKKNTHGSNDVFVVCILKKQGICKEQLGKLENVFQFVIEPSFSICL